MNILKEKKRRIMIISLISVIIVSLLVVSFKTFSTDSIYYRTYTKENGWSKWVKDGKTSGNGKDDILNIQIKVKSKDNSRIIYRTYNINSEWSEQKTVDSKNIKNENINAVKIVTSDNIHRKYSVFYRTYNKEDKWLEWTNDGQISGNKNETIKQIQIKLLQRDTSLEDYLEDYSKKEIRNVGFNEEGE